MSARDLPELLAPAGSLDAVRAAVANGADAIYLGAERFNARDEGAQLTLPELEHACALAHAHGVRIYLTLNTLIKASEMADALELLGEAIDRGVDAAIVQDVGLVRAIQEVFPGFELHGSTQMTVHDESGARFMRGLGVERVVLARENTLDDVRTIRAAVPDLGLETFVHGALCISYSGQCFMSGMISERSANRGSCAQSCRKDYVLSDAASGAELDRGYLISARDLAAHDRLADLAELGIRGLKVEGRKKKPEYVATVTRSYRDFLDRVGHGEAVPPTGEDVRPLVQIFSRGFTGGMFEGRSGRDYVTRDHPDNRGHEIGVVLGWERGELMVEVSHPVRPGDGLGFEPPVRGGGEPTGFGVTRVRTLDGGSGRFRQALATGRRVPAGWRVVRSAEAALLERARASYGSLPPAPAGPRERLDVSVWGTPGEPLRAAFFAGGEMVEATSAAALAPARQRALDGDRLREQLGRLGETEFELGELDTSGLPEGVFLPVSELNRLRQAAVEELAARRARTRAAATGERKERIVAAAAARPSADAPPVEPPFTLAAEAFALEDARAAAAMGATEVVLDPFLRHPAPRPTQVRALAEELAASGVRLRLRTPTIVRPEDRRALSRWLDLGLPLQTGHAGLLVELAAEGRDVTGDYALNVFNPRTAAEFFARGARRLALSLELTVREIADVVRPWRGRGFEVLVYGRPEGMILEHCVLSAAFGREVNTCRDLCVQKHPAVELTDPTGYTFPVATDSACRNRLLHSRPLEGSEFIPALWEAGIRSYRAVFNVRGDPVQDIVRAYADALTALHEGRTPGVTRPLHDLLANRFTRGHFVRAV